MKAENLNITAVDTLGQILAQKAELEKQEKAIKAQLIDQATAGGDKVVEGALFKATYVEANTKSVDWKQLIADMGVDSATLDKYTKTSARFSIRVTSR